MSGFGKAAVGNIVGLIHHYLGKILFFFFVAFDFIRYIITFNLLERCLLQIYETSHHTYLFENILADIQKQALGIKVLIKSTYL